MLVKLAGLHAMQGHFEMAGSFYEQSKAMCSEMGQEYQVAASTMFAEAVGLLAGDVDWAEQELRVGYESLERMGEKGARSTVGALLADTVYQQGQYDEAHHLARVCLQIAGADDVASQIWGRAVIGEVFAVQGRCDQGAENAREAVALARKTDDLYSLGQALMRLGEVLRIAERGDEEAAVLEETVAVAEGGVSASYTDGMSGIFLRQGDEFVEMAEQPYELENRLQVSTYVCVLLISTRECRADTQWEIF